MMKQEEFLEQLINEMKTVSEDFNHDEKAIKSLVTSMMESKPQVTQDPHFKTQLANNLARHIARKKNPTPSPAVSQSRLARFIAYGLPGLTLCFVVFYTLPFGGEDLSKTFETGTTTLQIALPVETGSSDMMSSGEVIDSWTQEVWDFQTASSPELVNNQSTDLWNSENLSTEEMPDELLMLLGISPTSQTQSTPSTPQVQSNTTQENTSSTPSTSPITQTVEHIPTQTLTPTVQTSSNNENPVSQELVLMKWATTTDSHEETTTWTSANLANIQISGERKSFADQVAKLLSVKITLRQGDIVDCLSEEWALTCDLFANRSFDKEHKSLLLDEIIAKLPSASLTRTQISQIKMMLGL